MKKYLHTKKYTWLYVNTPREVRHHKSRETQRVDTLFGSTPCAWIVGATPAGIYAANEMGHSTIFFPFYMMVHIMIRSRRYTCFSGRMLSCCCSGRSDSLSTSEPMLLITETQTAEFLRGIGFRLDCALFTAFEVLLDIVIRIDASLAFNRGSNTSVVSRHLVGPCQQQRHERR